MKQYVARLIEDGLLLKSDAVLPSVATFVAGGPVRGSWWAHPASHAIFRAIQELAARDDVVLVKLIRGKDTFVQERLWPALLAIATSNEAWQLDGLPKSAAALYRRVVRAGEIETSGPDARVLELRLLVRVEQFHSEEGHHERRLESWARWAERTGVARQPAIAPSAAKDAFEKIYSEAKWPWR